MQHGCHDRHHRDHRQPRPSFRRIPAMPYPRGFSVMRSGGPEVEERRMPSGLVGAEGIWDGCCWYAPTLSRVGQRKKQQWREVSSMQKAVTLGHLLSALPPRLVPEIFYQAMRRQANDLMGPARTGRISSS